MTKTKAKTAATDSKAKPAATKNPAPPAKKPAAPKKRAFTRFQIERFERLAAEISQYKNDIPDWFIRRAKSVEGLLLTEKPKGSGMWVASVAGLKTRPHTSQKQALKVWANKARRTVAAAGG